MRKLKLGKLVNKVHSCLQTTSEAINNAITAVTPQAGEVLEEQHPSTSKSQSPRTDQSTPQLSTTSVNQVALKKRVAMA